MSKHGHEDDAQVGIRSKGRLGGRLGETIGVVRIDLSWRRGLGEEGGEILSLGSLDTAGDGSASPFVFLSDTHNVIAVFGGGHALASVSQGVAFFDGCLFEGGLVKGHALFLRVAEATLGTRAALGVEGVATGERFSASGLTAKGASIVIRFAVRVHVGREVRVL